MKFKFTFSKTKFHGGRVIVGFVPAVNDPGPAGVLNSTISTIEILGGLPQPFSYCEVFDLKDASSFEFEVPFVSPDPFVDVTASIGAISMTVLDPLVTSGETSSVIDFMVEVKAGEDFEFGCPAAPMFGLLNPAVPANSVFLQSGLGGIEDIDSKVTQYTTGEKILSLKSLMMIPSYSLSAVAANSDVITSAFPYWFGSKFTPAIPMPPTSVLTGGFSRAANIATMYAFASGSTDHHLYFFGPATNIVNLSAVHYRTDNGVTTSSPGDPRYRGLTASQRVICNDNFMHVRVPSYQKFARVPVWDGNTRNDVGTIGLNVPLTSASTNNHTRFVLGTSTSGRVVYGRAAADDARCMCYIGPPPVCLLQGSQTSDPDVSNAPF